MSENKTLECSSDETTNEWKVGPGAWISLVIVLLGKVRISGEILLG